MLTLPSRSINVSFCILSLLSSLEVWKSHVLCGSITGLFFLLDSFPKLVFLLHSLARLVFPAFHFPGLFSCPIHGAYVYQACVTCFFIRQACFSCSIRLSWLVFQCDSSCTSWSWRWGKSLSGLSSISLRLANWKRWMSTTIPTPFILCLPGFANCKSVDNDHLSCR